MRTGFEGGKALVVGIGAGYAGRLALPPVVRADAEAIARVLKDSSLCGYLDENVQVLLDEQATRVSIIEGLRKLQATARPEDTVIFYFSGHGAQRFLDPDAGTFLCPVDFASDAPRATGIEAGELSSLMSGIAAAR